MRIILSSALTCTAFAYSPVASAWKQETSTEVRATALRLSANDPPVSRDDHLGSVTANLRFLQDNRDTQYRNELGVGYGKSFETDAAYQTVTGRSTLVLPGATSSDTFGIGALYSHGVDPIGLPLEETVANDPDDFTSFQANYGHQREFDPRQALRFELGLTRNEQSAVQILSGDALIAYIYRPLRTWSTTWRLRVSQQQAPNIDDNRVIEAANDHLWILNASLSAEAGIGYSMQTQGEEVGEGILYLAAINYSTQRPGEDEEVEKDSGTKPPKKDPPDIKSREGLLGASVLRAGWTRSRDQRRVGDPIFISDQFFASWALGLTPAQGLVFDVRQSVAIEGPQQGFRDNKASAAYRWNHEPFPLYKGQLGGEIAWQETESPLGAVFERNVYSLLYALIF